jgi:hypothetical protein
VLNLDDDDGGFLFPDPQMAGAPPSSSVLNPASLQEIVNLVGADEKLDPEVEQVECSCSSI